MKKQIVIIHGGYVYDINDDFLVRLKEKITDRDSFKSGSFWKDDFEEKLKNKFGYVKKPS